MPPPSQRNSIASAWWERSIVKRSTYTIQAMVDTMMEDSHFLQRHEAAAASSRTTVPTLHRNNIQVGALIGKGSFSVVLEVKGLIEDPHSQQDYPFGTSSSFLLSKRPGMHSINGRFVIKHLRPDLIQRPETFQAAAADLLMEAKYLAALDHPGILKLRAVAQGGVSAFETTGGKYDGFFLIIDRLDGTLRDRILEWQVLLQDESLLEVLRVPRDETKAVGSSDGGGTLPLSERLLLEKLDIARQLASALEYMHDRRLIFRDLKPPNVGMTAENRVQLFDFGFARELPSWGGEYQMLQGQAEDEDDSLYYMSGKGSLMYLAPEVLQNGRYNRKADCYGFAMVLYELLTLNKPFHNVSGIEVFRDILCRHKARPPLQYSDIPFQLQDLLRHSWTDDVGARWSMRKICHRLQEISEELDPLLAPQAGQVENETDQHVLSEPALCGGGLLLDLIEAFVKDIRLGYKILSSHETGNQKILELPEQREESPRCGGVSSHTEVTGILTAPTDASSAFTFCGSHHSLRITAMTATEEPLEVTLEEAPLTGRSSSAFAEDEHPWDENHFNDGTPLTPRATHSDANDYGPLTPFGAEEDARGTEEVRCPPSPPLQRTDSAPAEHKDLANSKTTMLAPISPHYPQRRLSTGAIKGFILPQDESPHYPETPHYPERRQSTGGRAFVFTESHFLPQVELRG